MATLILSFGAIFLLVAGVGVMLFYRETMLQRIQEVINPRPKSKGLISTIQDSKFSVGSLVQRLEHIVPKSQSEMSVVSQRLIRAGFRNESAIKVFYGCKALAPVLLCAIAFFSGVTKLAGPFFTYATCLAVGYLGPDFWLGKKITARQKRIRRGLPDVLDLLIICVEAGLSLDQATARTAMELNNALPDLCDELNIVVLEQRAGRARSEAWKHMVERTDEDSVRNMVSMLVQSEQLGTSIARTLRVHSETLRTQRVQQVEELAAKTSVKLVFPLVFFIFPALFLVTLGPAGIVMSESFQQLLHP